MKQETVAEEFRQTGVRPVPSLGWGWLRGFQTRYPELALLYGGNGKHYCNTWSTYAVLKDNYEMTYEKWVQWGLAEVLPSPQWQDRDGNEVDKKDPTRFGCLVKHRILRPEWIVAFDETGDNTNQSDTKVNRHDKLLVKRNGRKPLESASTNDIHYTSVGAICLTGVAVTGTLMPY